MPPEDVRESRLRSVIKRHCHSAKGFSWEALPQKKNKKREEKTLLLRLMVLTYTLLIQVGPPDSSQSPEEANEPNPLSSNEEG